MKKTRSKHNMTPVGSAAVLSLAVLVTALGITACGAGGSKSANQIAATMCETTAAASADTAGRGVYGGYMATEAAMPAEMRMEDAVMDEGAAAPAGGMTAGTPAAPALQGRKLIRTVNLQVETTEYDRLIEDINRQITDAGGYLEHSDLSGTSLYNPGRGRYANLTVRIPADKLDAFLSQVGEACNITSRSENTQDITLQYSDIESRKKSLTIEQERLWALLEKADTLESVIALEERLSEIRYQLESFESNLRIYDNQVDYSTVYISINEVQVFTPTAPDSIGTRIQKGFSRNLNTAINSAVNFFIWLITTLPILIPLVIVLAFILILIRKFSRNRKAAGKTSLLNKKNGPLKKEEEKSGKPTDSHMN